MPPQGLRVTGKQREATLDTCGGLTLSFFCSKALLAKDLKLRFKGGEGKKWRLERH